VCVPIATTMATIVNIALVQHIPGSSKNYHNTFIYKPFITLLFLIIMVYDIYYTYTIPKHEGCYPIVLRDSCLLSWFWSLP
jgi:hypothetical protein